MIFWKDFILDDVCGPLLVEDPVRDANVTVCRGKRTGGSSVVPKVMEDAMSEQVVQIQETGQEQRPARMVGLSSLDFQSSAGTEAGQNDRATFSRRREEA